MSGDTRRLHLRFSMQRPEQKRAYETISAIPAGRRMEYICRLINMETHVQDLEQHIITAVRTALAEYQPQNLPFQEDNTAEEIPQQMMDFLTSL